ncbi:MAG: helix-turn-helix domain-containing protein [Desulfobaccales bacterium]
MHGDFFIGIKEIAGFLRVHPRTAQRYLRTGKIPAKRDGTGRWVLLGRDYFKSLVRSLPKKRP